MPEINKKKWWFHSLTVDVVIFTISDGNLKVLLIERANKPFFGAHALPGGFLYKNEQAYNAAKRILKEKAGVSGVYIEQLYTFDKLERDPRGQVISVSYFALVPFTKIKIKESKQTQSPSFYSITKLPKLAFDHKEIIQYAVKRLRSKLEYTNLAFFLLPEEFSLYQLQRVYEIILGRKLDKRNFQKKFFFLGLISPTKKVLTGFRQRPARLYRFKEQKLAELKKFF